MFTLLKVEFGIIMQRWFAITTLKISQHWSKKDILRLHCAIISKTVRGKKLKWESMFICFFSIFGLKLKTTVYFSAPFSKRHQYSSLEQKQNF